MGRHKGSKTGTRRYNKYFCLECNNEFERHLSYPKEKARFCSKSCQGKYYGKLRRSDEFKKLNESRRGKTIIEMYGKEKVEEFQKVKAEKIYNNWVTYSPIHRKHNLKEAIAEYQLQGKGIGRLMREHHCCFATLKKLFKENGIKTRENKYLSSGSFKPNHDFHGNREEVIKKIKETRTPIFKLRVSELYKEKFKDKKYRDWWFKQHLRQPNKVETNLISIINKLDLPYEYVGDWRFFIGKKNPDFIHKGKKKVIEILGEYWHSPLLNPSVTWDRTQVGLEEHYKKYGYKCLFLWYKEFKNMDNVINKIIAFENGTSAT